MKAVRPAIPGTNTIVVAVSGQNVGYPMSAVIRNPGPGTIYLGHQGVTSSNGFPLATDEAFELDLVNENLYAVATVTTTVYVLRRGD